MKSYEDFNTGAEDLSELDFGGEKESYGSFSSDEGKVKYVNENIWSKLQKAGRKISFAKDIVALMAYMRDPFVSWHRKAIVVTALIYFITPIDTIPDIAPLVGYLDDLGVIAALLKYLGSELTPYYDPAYRS